MSELNATMQMFGILKKKKIEKKKHVERSLNSPVLHLFDLKYSKNSNIVKL